LKRSTASQDDALDRDEFADFFFAVHGHEPFPWQRRLAALVFEEGWPVALDVPTSAGKTAAIDIAVFHLALEAHLGSKRAAALRTLFVVDRRLVVDDAFARAEKIAIALARPTKPVLERVARRLRRFAEDGRPPLAVAKLRGGAPKENDWVRTPAQPAVVVSTVDQVGSRLLFRGYGVSDGMWPVHAGLIGNDARIFLDEAHLSQPFAQTVRELCSDLKSRVGVVTLSATQQDEAPTLVEDDDRKHDVLGPRLTRSKLATLLPIDEPSGSDAFAAAFAAEAWRLSRASGVEGATADVVVVVVNRVLRAREVFEKLIGVLIEHGLDPKDSAALLTGRSRPLDREERLRLLLPRMKANPDRKGKGAAPPLFVVATQCIEAGADLDFDALVTEVAPLDSLRQRFGRLNRLGRPIEPSAAILAASDQIGKRAKPDPVYGGAVAKTWELLDERAAASKAKGKGNPKEKRKVIDFGVEPSRAWMPPREALEPYAAPRKDAPVLMPIFVERWAQTSPPPASEADVALFLHGPGTGPAEVQIIWRADLDDRDSTSWSESVNAAPPSNLEAMSLPLWEVQRWLANKGGGFASAPTVVSPEISDVEGAPDPEQDDVRGSGAKALRWLRTPRRDGTRGVVVWRPHELHPGDTVVVPASYGGCDAWGWQPLASQLVVDLASHASIARQRGKTVLRLSPSLLHAEIFRKETALAEDLSAAALARARAAADHAAERRRNELAMLREESGDVIRRAFASEVLARRREVLDTLKGLQPTAVVPVDEKDADRDVRPRVIRRRDGEPLALEWFLPRLRRASMKDDPTTVQAHDVEPIASEATTGSEASSRGEKREVRLKEHSRGVEELAKRFAEQAGLDDDRLIDVATAALLHDAGKAQHAFKCWLYGGDELAAHGEALAKSRFVRISAAARERAGLPTGARHEVASLTFAEAHPRLAEAKDPELVLWLIGTHHGVGRPFFPSVEWPPPGETFEADVDGETRKSALAPKLAERQARWLDLHSVLHRRYGAWRLAHFEAILRLADHRRSEAEQREGPQASMADAREGAALDAADPNDEEPDEIEVDP
jgi:CRISPR-associated endonuclease/helicase Cas3